MQNIHEIILLLHLIMHLKWPLKTLLMGNNSTLTYFMGLAGAQQANMDSMSGHFALCSNYISPTHAASLFSICDQTHMESRGLITAGRAKTEYMCAFHTNCQLRIT